MLQNQTEMLRILTILTNNTKHKSGTYYTKLDGVWEFEMKACRGDFETMPRYRTEPPPYLEPILRARINDENIDLKEDNVEHLSGMAVSGKNSSISCDTRDCSEEKKGNDDDKVQLSTPKRRNSDASFNNGSGDQSNAKNNASRKNSQNSRSSNGGGSEESTLTNEGSRRSSNGKGKEIEHIFGGEKEGSYAHLFPPKAPACREFFEYPFPFIFGPLEDFDLFQRLRAEVGEREATMVLIRAISDCEMNKIPLPVDHASYFDDDLDQGTLLLIPIISTEEALGWQKGQGYSILVVANS